MYMKRLFLYIFSAILLVSCTSDLENGLDGKDSSGIVVSARCTETKSVLDSDLNVLWSEEDRITVLSLDGSASVVSEQGGADFYSCDFIVNGWPKDATPRYAVFNGSSQEASASIEGRYIESSIPTVQYISDDCSFGRDANLSIGELKMSSDGRWQTEMKNVCALVGFSLERFDNVKAVSVYNREGVTGLSGTFRIFMEDGVPVIKETVDGYPYVAARMADAESVFKTGATYYVCVRPDIDFTPEFVFLLDDGKVYKYRSEEQVRIRRSTVMDFGVVDTYAVKTGLEPTVGNENFVEGGSIEVVPWELVPSQL